ncbi:MAG: phosphate ABC transporter ATP-binding protein [Acidimicrobiia bacterium]|nr:phosphate ABC transporter ATP-binding protein [Acidimicrobiia bacterium]NNF08807.1 phosphate ABC transporter ATP-binding protein [Acidimicrobiia bacterium]NNL68917.1 phosphate ABC transporter ATP-binding protein [Acidimicrobiia bacterium]
MSDQPLFELSRVSVVGSSGARLREVSLSIAAQGITVLLGPSGSGKSTLLRICNRLEVPTSGDVTFRGTPVAAIDPLELRRQVGMVFQQPVLFAGTVRDNLAEANGAPDTADFTGALRRASLDETFLDRPAGELSGGEAQRVCVARALVAGPDALLMDEPTSSLDGAAVSRLEDLGRGLADAGTPVVWVTHDLAQMARLADAVAVLLDGTVRFTGTPGELEHTDDRDVIRFLEAGNGTG